MAVLRLGTASVSAERAQATADVVALAAATGGDGAAAAVAGANGAALVAISRTGSPRPATGSAGARDETWVVTVARDSTRRSAAAGAR